jgi:hypothetical protein
MEDKVPLTLVMLDQLKTPKGGYDRQTLEMLGIGWPPKSGWRKRLLGTLISISLFNYLTGKKTPVTVSTTTSTGFPVPKDFDSFLEGDKMGDPDVKVVFLTKKKAEIDYQI